MTSQAMRSANAPGPWAPNIVYAFGDSWNQACAFAKRCGAQFGICDVHRFPDGETLVSVSPSTAVDQQVVAVYRSLHDPNTKLVELILAVNALRALGARRLVLIAPYLPYMRQDRAFEAGQSVSQAAIGDLLAGLFDAIVTIQPHLHRTRSLAKIFAEKPAFDLGAGRAIAAHMRTVAGHAGVIVGPDEESEPLIRDVADELGASWFVARKVRHGDNEVTITVPDEIDVEGQPVAIVDDIVSSGGTVIALAKALKKAGAAQITLYAVHALFDQRAAVLMARAGVSQVRSLSTVPHVTNAVPVDELICAGLGIKI